MKERGNRILKIFDKYAGIPLVVFLGATRKKRHFDIRSVRPDALRFVLLKTAAIGDTVMLSAAIQEIKHAYPGSFLTLIVSRANEQTAALLAGVDDIVIFDMSSPLRSLKIVARRQKAHVLLDFAPWARINSLIAYAMKAELKIGFRTKGTGRHYVFDRAVEHSNTRHELDNYRSLLHAIPMETTGYAPALMLDRMLLDRADSLLGNSRLNVVFHPFPGGYKKHLKEWPLIRWVETGRRLIKKGCMIYISGDQDDLPVARLIQAELNSDGRHCMVLCGHFSLAEVAAILYKSRMLITVNTGIMHIAAALKVNMIALHGPTSPLRWGPVDPDAIVLKPGLECAPCISLGYEYQCRDGGCMQTISVDDVMQKAEMILGRSPGDVLKPY